MEPDSTAVRVALWRALHVQCDPPPHVLEDEVGLQLVAPEESWRQRPDMHLMGTRGYRASIVARARFIEDLVIAESSKNIHQYVILGAGLDTFAQRRADLAAILKIFEVDKPETQAWKKQRLIDLGYGVPEYLKLVPVDFEASESWWNKIISKGFEIHQPAIITSTGVSMYLTKEAVEATLRQVARLAPGSIFVMTFIVPLDLIDAEERAELQAVYERARAAGTPFVSFFSPGDITDLALKAGFKATDHISTKDLADKYFAQRDDGLIPSSGEYILIAKT